MASVGRPANEIAWITVTYEDCEYLVGKIKFKDTYVYSIVDKLYESSLSSQTWHVVAGSYIGHSTVHEAKRKTVYMHNYVMERQLHGGKGQQITVDHINGIGFDNRLVNLRELTQSLQNKNTRDRQRKTTELPSEINQSEIPRNIWYIPASGTHGDRFAVEIKGIPNVGSIIRKTTSAKSISTRDKLIMAIDIKNQLIDMHPSMLEHSRESDKSKTLKDEYYKIVEMAKVIYMSQ